MESDPFDFKKIFISWFKLIRHDEAIANNPIFTVNIDY